MRHGSQPRPFTRCRRCGLAFERHKGDGPEFERRCPHREGTFRRLPPRAGASQSFSPAEIATLEALVWRARATAAGAPELMALRRKVLAMRAVARERERQRLQREQHKRGKAS